MRTIHPKKNQTLFDLALQEYGDWSGCLWLLEDNRDVLRSVTDVLHPSLSLRIREVVMNGLIKNHLKGYDVATENTDNIQGIGVLRISINTVINA